MFFKKKNYFLNLCLFMMMLGVCMGMNSNAWLMMWLSMEITLMFFLPLLMLNKSMSESFSCLKYFIFQCLGSIFFILGSFDLFFFNTFGLILKLGVFPNHFWMLSVSKGLNWFNFFLFMSVQKILPLLFICFSLKFIFFNFIILLFFNSLVGNLGSINQMMFSSILNYLNWTKSLNLYMMFKY
uniref:NADH-ubiquinone oxidoreductase chain 2 n=1 Tax=Gynaikothrips uzeli TaxID=1422814 RepID=A0A8A5L602_9NEOP|nr:NADH dehydrogenase subunit 2 [Gynaikothrips uzeli]